MKKIKVIWYHIYIYIYYLKWNYVKYCEISHSLCIQPYAFLYRMTFLHIPPTQGQDLPPQSQLPQQPVFFIAKNRQQLGILRNLTIITWFLYVENYQLPAGLHEQNTWIFERFERKTGLKWGISPDFRSGYWFNMIQQPKYELRQWVDHQNHVSIYLLKLFRESVWGINSRRPKNESWQIMANHGKSWQIPSGYLT